VKLLESLLLASATVALSYCGFVWGDAWLFQQRAREVLALPVAEQPVVRADGLIGRIDIPRIGLSAVVFEGTDSLTLRRSVGHVAFTALPGQPGNIGLAGHRDSFFRPLKDIRQDDIITLATTGGEYSYRVVSAKVVKPTEVSVLSPTGNEMLTLVTCHPFYFVGAAPNRFIVRAARVISQ
jgi:sortase A